ncbi:MAG: Chitinase A precursor [bacterium ADurb.Bin429]|nr:MAG: Chitinase A precursor [bacterium ADurb.Bin429]
MPDSDIAYHGVVSYVIQLENYGSVDAADVFLTDTLPLNVTFLNWIPAQPPGAARSGNVVTWQGAVPASGAIGLLFRVQHTGGYGETVTNRVEYSHATGAGSAAATFAVVANTAPVILEGDVITLTMFEDSPPVTTTLQAVDNDPLYWALATPPLHGVASVGDTGDSQVITYTPSANYNGSDAFVVRVSDDFGGADVITVAVVITPVNDAPVLSPIGPQTVNEGDLLTFTATADDPDGDALAFSAAPLPSGALFAGGVFTWTPDFDAAGVYTVTVTASDGALTATEAVPITVYDVNRAPVLTPIGPQTVNEGDLLTFTVTADDPDGDALAFSAMGLPPGALFVRGVFTWTPGCEAAGIYTTTFVVSDGILSDTEAVNITVIEACSPSRRIYLPLALRAYGPRALLGPFPAIPAQPAAIQGGVFYTAPLSLTAPLPAAGRFYFSGAPDCVVPIVIDDRLVLVRAGQGIFTHTFSLSAAPPAPAVVELPRRVMLDISAGGVTLVYQDVYGASISADAVWLVWTP